MKDLKQYNRVDIVLEDTDHGLEIYVDSTIGEIPEMNMLIEDVVIDAHQLLIDILAILELDSLLDMERKEGQQLH